MISFDGVTKKYPDGTVAVDDLTLEVPDGTLTVFVGPSGCGKTTLLKCMSGLLDATSGEVRLRGRPLTGTPEDMALVFQEYGRSLFPWMTVRDNIRLPLKHKQLGKAETAALVEDAVEAVGLSGFIDRYPWQLSGGMQQRVAIARALAYQPAILLMDEPFASVDAQTRADLEDLTLDLRRRYGMTILFVTHDIDESVYLGDRIVVLTPAPTTVQEVLDVDLPQPRDQVRTKEHAEFARLRARIYTLIKRGAASGDRADAAVAGEAAS